MSSDRSHRAWLRDELVSLQRQGVLDAEASARLRSHYALDALGDATSTRKLVLALLGALLVGAGVILLFAHNWEALSRSARAAVSLGQLALAQAAVLYAITQRAGSAAWREASASLLALSVGAAIALVSQTYHLEGELGDFMLWWLVLALPLAYVVPARSVVSLVALGAPVLATAREHAPDRGLVYYAVLAALLPALQPRMPARQAPALTMIARWVVALSLPMASAALVVDRDGAPWLPFYAALAGSFVAAGALLERDAPHAAQRPLSIVGGLGVTALLLTLSYDESFRAWTHGALPWRPEWLTQAAFVLASVAGVGLLALAAPLWRTREPSALLLAGGALVALVLYALRLAGVDAGVLAALASASMLALGALLLTLGLRATEAGLANRGLSVLTLLLVARFFDTDISFVVRGVGFVLLGLSFLAINGWLARKHKERAS